jgi:RNA polymerase sigma-70 factor (ECF subfamily)
MARAASTLTPASFRDELLAAAPALRAMATSLVGYSDRADDLIQDTLLKAWGNSNRYEPGTNLRGWLSTILKNTLYTQNKKYKHEIGDADGKIAAELSTPAGQDDHMDLEDLKLALAQIPPAEREALMLVGASGFSYEETAEICGCLVGTIKSRVSRARGRLAEILDQEPSGLAQDANVSSWSV